LWKSTLSPILYPGSFINFLFLSVGIAERIGCVVEWGAAAAKILKIAVKCLSISVDNVKLLTLFCKILLRISNVTKSSKIVDSYSK